MGFLISSETGDTQVPADDGVPEKRRDQRSRRKKDAERELSPAPPSRICERQFGLTLVVRETARREWIHYAEQNDRGNRGGNEDREEGTRWPERGTDDRHQSDVAETHCRALEPDFAEPSSDRDGAGADAHTEDRVPRARERLGFAEVQCNERCEQHEEQTEHRKAVGNEEILGVGDRDSKQQRREHGHAESGDRHSELKPGGEPKQSHQHLDDRILNRNPLVAVAAPSAEEDPAKDGNVLPRLDLVPALRTSRARLDHRESFRPATDTHIEKRPDRGPNDEHVQTFKNFDHYLSS